MAEKLLQPPDMIEKILSSLPGAILIINQDRQVEYANPLAEQHFGSEGARLVGSLVDNVLPLTESRWNLLMGEVKVFTAGAGKRQPDGEFEVQKRVYQYRLFPVNGRDSEEQQTGIVIWEITEQKQLQDRLIQAEKLASLGSLVSGMAHEINNPVHGILGMAEIIVEEKDPERIKEYATDIVGFAKHVATVVSDMALYIRPATHDREVEIDLGERLGEALKMVRRNPRFGHVEVVTEFQPVPRLRARRTEIDQVFVNLISNAVQAMDDESSIRKPVKLTLTKAGYEVVEAQDGEQAIKVLNSDDNPLMVDTILCDIQMPKINGIDAIAYFRTQYPTVPVVVMTGYPDVDLAVTLMKQGVRDYLVKPVSKEKLLTAISEAVDNHVILAGQFVA